MSQFQTIIVKYY